jgi:hypothetical protein
VRRASARREEGDRRKAAAHGGSWPRGWDEQWRACERGERLEEGKAPSRAEPPLDSRLSTWLALATLPRAGWWGAEGRVGRKTAAGAGQPTKRVRAGRGGDHHHRAGASVHVERRCTWGASGLLGPQGGTSERAALLLLPVRPWVLLRAHLRGGTRERAHRCFRDHACGFLFFFRLWLGVVFWCRLGLRTREQRTPSGGSLGRHVLCLVQVQSSSEPGTAAYAHVSGRAARNVTTTCRHVITKKPSTEVHSSSAAAPPRRVASLIHPSTCLHLLPLPASFIHQLGRLLVRTRGLTD